jgi:hypothetical protein
VTATPADRIEAQWYEAPALRALAREPAEDRTRRDLVRLVALVSSVTADAWACQVGDDERP